MSTAPTYRLGVMLYLGLALLALSCGAAGPPLYQVRGKVFFQDKPAEGAVVVFHPSKSTPEALRPSGVVDADGCFSLNTHPHGAGAPAGDYGVVITWLPANARQAENARNKLPARYADPQAPILKATVKEGANELEPFKLTR